MEENIETNETIFEKGIGLEKEFAEYLKSDLGWEKARIRSQMASKFNMRGTNVDVIAERINKIESDRFNLISLGYFLVFIVFFIYGLSITETDFVISLVILVFSIAFFSFGLIFRKTAINKIREHAWVECKNLKTKVNISQVQKTIDELKHYKETENREYKFVEVYFVSSNGFVENALKLAIDNKINCFIKEGNKFKKIDYWNH